MSKTLFLMVGAFTICLLPITVVVFCEVFYLQNLNPMQKYLSFDAKKSFQFQVAGLLAHIFLLSNSSMNGMIYSWMSWRFRGEAKIFIFKVMKKNTCIANSWKIHISIRFVILNLKKSYQAHSRSYYVKLSDKY